MSEVEKRLQSHPHWPAVEAIYHTLQANGYKAFLAGGCVRDALLGVPANDLDVATDANPYKIEALFEKTVGVGKNFGVMRVILKGADIEVATFRTDGDYKDGRRPSKVSFSSPEEDAQRRDFTVNALFFDMATHQILDFVEGQKDLAAKRLATVGDPEKRFQEDHLRLLRAARFVAQLDFPLEERSFAAVKKMSSLVASVSGERIRDEMVKLLKSQAVSKGLSVMVESGMMAHLFSFRAKDSSWDLKMEVQDAWKLLALFLRKASLDELKKSIKLLKISSRDQKAIEVAWQLWKKPEDFFGLPKGKRILKIPEEGTLFALNILISESHVLTPQIKDLQAEWQQWGGELPKAFLTGDDAKGMHGRQIGQALAAAYELQLERKLNSRDEALEWLKKYGQKDVHG